MRILLIACLGLLSFIIPTQAAMKVDPIIGLWYTEGHEGGIEFYACGDEICGRLYWLKDSVENNDVPRDVLNPDPAKRDRPLCHLEFMTGFQPDGQGQYADGLIYSPRHGQNFDAEMTLIDQDTLKVRGYILIPLFGESQVWVRAKKMPECSAIYEPAAR